jgi:hypothetical protein
MSGRNMLVVTVEKKIYSYTEVHWLAYSKQIVRRDSECAREEQEF